MTRLFFLVFLLFMGTNSCTRIQYETVYQPVPAETIVAKPKNIILMIGDGMGLPQITAGVYSKKKGMAIEQFPVVGLQKCQSKDNLVNDSAAGATAMACGVKTNNKALGMDEEGKHFTSIMKECSEKEYATGFLTSSSIVHATPAGFYAHQPDRYQYERIALDFIRSEVDLAIGGGKKYFDRRSMDDKNLYKALLTKGYVVEDFLEHDITRYSLDAKKKLVFFTADSEPLPASQGRDYMALATDKSINFLKKRSGQGFFLLVEGAQIDWAGHAKNSIELISEVRDFDEAIAQALKFAQEDGETLLIVTADHETGGMTLDPNSKASNLKANFSGNQHTPQMVPVFAYGPGSHLFSGVYENTAIYTKMRSALNLEAN